MASLVGDKTSKLSLPKKVGERAENIYREATESNLVRGRKVDVVIAGSLFIACRQMEVPRSLSEVAEAFSLDEKEVCKNYRYILRNLNTDFPPPDLEGCVRRLSEKLDLEDKVEEEAVEIVKKVNRTNLSSGKDPFGVAAGAVYIAGCLLGRRRSQSEIGKAASVTEVTVRKRYMEIIDKLNIEGFELE